MRVLRTTMYPPPGEVLGPMTMVIAEDSLKEGLTLEDAIEEDHEGQEIFQIDDIFETEEGGPVDYTFVAAQRLDEDQMLREKNMAIMFYYTIERLRLLTPTGTSIQDRPAPLSRDEMIYTIKAIMRHPAYQHQSIQGLTEDMEIIVGKDGEILP